MSKLMADEDETEKDDFQLWGEYKNAQTAVTVWNKSISNFEQDVIINSVKNTNLKTCFFDFEKEFKFPIRKEIGTIKMDNLMKDTVQLMKYKNDVEDMIESKQLKLDILNFDEQLYRKIMNKNKKKKELAQDKIQFYKHPDSNFTRGIWTEKPFSISADSTLNVLRISVSTILAFIGFSETTVLPLQVLTEVAENYIKKMLKLLRVNVEKELLCGETGFCDIVDRTFHEMGFGSLINIIPYYQDSVSTLSKTKIGKYKRELRSYDDAIKKLKEQQVTKNLNSSVMEEENMIVPELHVTSMMRNELLSESFKSDLQILQTLEAEDYVTCHKMKNENTDSNSTLPM